MNIYIAAHCQDEARKVASHLITAGHVINSSWLVDEYKPTAEHTEAERASIAANDVMEVMQSDCVVLLASPYRVPGGKFVEVGVALGLCKPVYVLGHRENMIMWHPLVSQSNSVEDLVKSI
jgi:nucleoside 2-deoxyribosyltransferase